MNALPFGCLLMALAFHVSRAAIPVEMVAKPVTFDALPPTNEWTTLHVPGGASDISNFSGLNAMVQNYAAGDISNRLTASTFYPSSGSGELAAVWSSPAHLLETRPTGAKALVLMARLENRTGRDLSALHLSYRMGAPIQFQRDAELPGFHVYFSLTGNPNTWQYVPELSGFETNARVSAMLELGAWPANGEMFLLWADDNNVIATDVSNTIDDFLAEPLRATITRTDSTHVQLSWPIAATNYDLVWADHPQSAGWEIVPVLKSTNSDAYFVVMPIEEGRFFTLRKSQTP